MKYLLLLLSCFLFLDPIILQGAEPVTNSLGMKLIFIQQGTFLMGQDGPPLEDYLRQKRFGELWKARNQIDFDEKPAHKVTITKPFLMGATEVTVGQYRQFDPDFKKDDPKTKPAEDDAASAVTWEKAVEFCKWLSKKEGKNYRLPTEAEWEYACRAGTTTLFNTGNDLPYGHQKWFGNENYRGVYFPQGPMPEEYDWRNAERSSSKDLKQGQVIGLIHPPQELVSNGAGALRVGKKTPNRWGLHDMHGNLGEWCQDWYGPYEPGEQVDPLGRVDGDYRVFRGGFHSSMIRFLRSANRGSWVQNAPSDRIGFRVVQAEPTVGKFLPRATPPMAMQNVSQSIPVINQQPNSPYFQGPKPFVRIAEGAVGPVFISQNHSPSITECPNGDLLAVWFSTLGETDLTTSIAAARLRYGASDWDPASAFWDAQDVNDHAPKIWWDGDKTIYHMVEARQHGANLIRRSLDNGVTWSKAEFLRTLGEPANHPIRLKNGIIAMPYDNASIVVSRDNGKTWESRGRHLRGSDDVSPGKSGPFIAGIHAPIVELSDGRLMAFGRLSPEDSAQKKFYLRMPVSYSRDLGDTWEWQASAFPVVSNTQKPVLLRLKEGPILLCSFTDQARTPFKERHGLVFQSKNGEYKGTGLYAALSYDEGKTWPDRRLIAPDGKTNADINGYLAITQTRDGRIQLVTSQNHYVFNLAWIQDVPSGPRK